MAEKNVAIIIFDTDSDGYGSCVYLDSDKLTPEMIANFQKDETGRYAMIHDPSKENMFLLDTKSQVNFEEMTILSLKGMTVHITHEFHMDSLA